MTSPTADELAEWKRIDDAATKGKWLWHTTVNGSRVFHYEGGGSCRIADITSWDKSGENADLIVTARNNFRRLIDEVERLRTTVASQLRRLNELTNVEIDKADDDHALRDAAESSAKESVQAEMATLRSALARETERADAAEGELRRVLNGMDVAK